MKKISFDYFLLFRRYESFIVSGSVILAVIVCTGVFLIPNIFRAREILSQQKTLAGRLTNLEKKSRFLSSLDSQLLKDTFPKLTVVLPSSKDFVNLFTTFDTLQEHTGVSILRTDFQLGSISTASAAKTTKVAGISAFTVPMRLEILGSFEQIRDFFEATVSLSNRLLAIDLVTWTFLDNGAIKANIEGRAFYYPLPSKIGSIETQLPQMNKVQQENFTTVSQLEMPSENTDQYEDIVTGKKNLFD